MGGGPDQSARPSTAREERGAGDLIQSSAASDSVNGLGMKLPECSETMRLMELLGWSRR